MKKAANTNRYSLFDLEESLRIEKKMLIGKWEVVSFEVEFLELKAKEGAPYYEFNYGLYFLLCKDDMKTAKEWWDKFLRHADGYDLWRASGVFFRFGEQYHELAMEYLELSAKKNYELAKAMILFLEEHPSKLPQA